ncbi:hypothetical protein OS493_020145 [Desmophyllum pertusum]|uniref:Uncharacterized protein n=1 Tax=Desmophyllum pertusum TaxID=174260 RepID=A0A9X0A174_9CNID|nr:hypothetical protein OS493_020145 [Desmophyllum pertusum]
MCCTNLSDFVANLHALNGNCSTSGNHTSKLGYLNHPVTSIIYIVTAVLCILLSLVTHFKYNSVTVLNLRVRSNVISNVAWIAYLVVLVLRSTLGAVIYGITQANDRNHQVRLTVYFIADGVLKSLEILCLSLALYHQWRYRSAGFIQQEINSFNSGEYSVSGSEYGVLIARQLMSYKAAALFVTQFILAMLFLTLLEALHVKEKTLEPLYWTYMGLLWTQSITAIVWVILIATNKNEDGPTLVTKLLLVVGVVITLPGDIPSFVWSSCITSHKCIPWYYLTYYDLALFLSIPSVIIFFLVLRTEFLRLDQEAQYSVLGGEVDSLFSIHSQSTEHS